MDDFLLFLAAFLFFFVLTIAITLAFLHRLHFFLRLIIIRIRPLIKQQNVLNAPMVVDDLLMDTPERRIGDHRLFNGNLVPVGLWFKRLDKVQLIKCVINKTKLKSLKANIIRIKLTLSSIHPCLGSGFK